MQQGGLFMTWEPFQEPPPGPQAPLVEYGATRPAPGPFLGAPHYDPSQAWGAPGPAVNAPPLTLWEAVKQLPKQYWRVLTKPGTAVFNQEMGNARWDVIWVQIVGYAVASAVLVSIAWLVLLAVLSPLFNSFSTESGQTSSSFVTGFLFVPIPFLAIYTLVGAIGGFFLSQGITYLLAKAFGGQGSFMTQAYTFLLFQVPIGIGGLLLSLIPLVGSIGSFAGIYAYVLETFQIMAVHRLSGGKAVAVVLIPVAAAILLVIIIYAIFLFTLFSSLYAIPASH
jgi:hypothetical protein